MNLSLAETRSLMVTVEDKCLTFIVIADGEDVGDVSVALAQSICVADVSATQDSDRAVRRHSTKSTHGTSETETLSLNGTSNMVHHKQHNTTNQGVDKRMINVHYYYYYNTLYAHIPTQ